MALKFKTQNEAEAEVDRLAKELSLVPALNEELSTVKKQLSDSRDSIASLTSEKSTLEQKIASLEAASKEFESRIEKAASEKALQIAASQGIPQPVAISDAKPTTASMQDEYLALVQSGKARAAYEFWEKNKKAMFGF